nr:MAG TPA: Mut7C Mut7-C ubiquitin [Caudoviricetes sp.]
MKKIVIEIFGQTAEITQKNCARVDEAIALRALLLRMKEGFPKSYLERYLGVKFVEKGNE